LTTIIAVCSRGFGGQSVVGKLELILSALPAFGEAPEGLSYTGNAEYCAPWTFLGAPPLFPGWIVPLNSFVYIHSYTNE
jgi:hypothetical protein